MEEPLFDTSNAKNQSALRQLTRLAELCWFATVILATPWIAYVNLFGKPTGTIADFKTVSMGYALILFALAMGTFLAATSKDDAGPRLFGRVVICLSTVASSLLWLELLFNVGRIAQLTSIFFFFAYLVFVWLARISFWLGWGRTPCKLELKIQDLVVAFLAGGAIVSRWADFAGLTADWFSPIFVFCGTTGLGLLLAKYTYELAELTAEHQS